MKYIAIPVEVDADIITAVGELDERGGRELVLGCSAKFRVDAGMLARYTPKPGDYLVTQADGYVYLNPKDVFERKYRPAPPNAFELGADIRRLGLTGDRPEPVD